MSSTTPLVGRWLPVLASCGLLAVGASTFVSCGNSNSSGSGAALSLPSRIELSKVESSAPASVTAPASASARIIAAAFGDPGTAYTLEAKRTWVNDTNALNMINSILDAVQGTAYATFVNTGPYKCLVEPVGDSEQSQGGSAATSATTESLMEMTVDVSRASGASPMIVKIWVKEEDGPGGSTMLIRGYFEVTNGVSTEFPYGVMEAHFVGTRLDSNGNEVGSPMFTMAMAISAVGGNAVVQIVETGAEGSGGNAFAWDRRARIIGDATFTTGNAYVFSSDQQGVNPAQETTEYFAFNSSYFKSFNVGTSATTVRDKSDLRHRVMRYKLFDSDTGAAITRTSGFPIQLANGAHAYVGYRGLWAPFGSTVENAATVTRTETGQTYTVVKVGGKLTKHTRRQVTLGDLTGAEISYYDNGTDIVVSWDGNEFKKVGTRSSTGPVNYLQTPTTHVFLNSWDGGWCEALQAWIRLGGLTPQNSDPIYYHEEQTVDPATVTDLTLHFWGFALDAPITQAAIDNSGSAKSTYFGGAPTEKIYFFDRLQLLLKEDNINGDPVLIGSGLNLANSEYSQGYTMSPMTTSNAYNSGNAWNIHEEQTYYAWSTGPNGWNQFTGLKDANGSFVAFDSPLKCVYTHTTANDINSVSTYDGKKFAFEYDGHELRIPWNYDEATAEWEPVINLRDGVAVTLASNGTTTYVVKGIEEELVMNEVVDNTILTNLQTTLPVDLTIAAPTITYSAAKTELVGALPTTAKLKVIKGEVVPAN